MKIKTLKELNVVIAAGNRQAIFDKIIKMLKTEKGPHWFKYLSRLAATCMDDIPRFSIMADSGNMKLPFIAFSALPGIGFCPGAGDCLNWCYSFRAWRYPAAYCRQAQNSILLTSKAGREKIAAALDKSIDKRMKKSGNDFIDFRLYVDGDFRTASDVKFWFDTIAKRPHIKTYGYSKSFDLILAADNMPENYVLNISGGHNSGPRTIEQVKKLSITRGEFIAVNMGKAVKSKDHNNPVHQKELRAIFGGKSFTCPGQCGSCTKAVHACGSMRFKDIPIIIGVH